MGEFWGQKSGCGGCIVCGVRCGVKVPFFPSSSSCSLKTILNLDIPFILFSQYFGLPALGVRPNRNSSFADDVLRIDYVDFLSQFQPVNQRLLKLSKTRAQGTSEEQKILDEISNVLFVNRFELESLFRYFDRNGDGKG